MIPCEWGESGFTHGVGLGTYDTPGCSIVGTGNDGCVCSQCVATKGSKSLWGDLVNLGAEKGTFGDACGENVTGGAGAST